MAELNGSGSVNTTKNVFRCSGSPPSKTVEIAAYLILMTFLLLANVLVVAVFYRNKTLRTAVHYFIVNMAISDLLLPVIDLPWMISDTYHDGIWLVDGALGSVLCKLARNARPISTAVSMLSMIAIAADRFRAVMFPMKSALFSRNRRRLIIAATWIASVAFYAHYVYATKIVPYGTKNYCGRWEPAWYTLEVIRITSILTLCLNFFFAIVLSVLYSSIIKTLQRQKNNLHLSSEIIKKRERRNRKIAYMLVTIAVVFYVVWIPYQVGRYYHYFKPHIVLPCFFNWFSNRIPLLYPVVNCVVYYVFKEEYRQGFNELLCCSWLHINNCTACLRSVPPEGKNGVHNAEQVDVELQEH